MCRAGRGPCFPAQHAIERAEGLEHAAAKGGAGLVRFIAVTSVEAIFLISPRISLSDGPVTSALTEVAMM